MFSFTFENGDVVELKGFKHSGFASHETHCYEASVYLNGKKIGAVSNDGKGGCDRFDGAGKNVEQFAENSKLWRDLECRIKSDHPKYHMDFDDSWNEMCMEVWCGEQVNKWLSHKDFKRTMRSNVVFTDPTSDDPKAIRYIGFKGTRKITQAHVAHITNKYPSYQVLNHLPEADALAIWQRGV
tara:strand:+ start:122 stop:670 length:549 start_codon:yes stop_codon:yes gene_type:complete